MKSAELLQLQKDLEEAMQSHEGHSEFKVAPFDGSSAGIDIDANWHSLPHSLIRKFTDICIHHMVEMTIHPSSDHGINIQFTTDVNDGFLEDVLTIRDIERAFMKTDSGINRCEAFRQVLKGQMYEGMEKVRMFDLCLDEASAFIRGEKVQTSMMESAHLSGESNNKGIKQ